MYLFIKNTKKIHNNKGDIMDTREEIRMLESKLDIINNLWRSL